MMIREEQSSDITGIRKVVQAAFPRPLEAKAVDQLRVDGDSVISLVAAEGDDVIGCVAFSRMSPPFKALGRDPVAMVPEKQGRGIDGKLIREGLKRAANNAWQAVFVLGDPTSLSAVRFRSGARPRV